MKKRVFWLTKTVVASVCVFICIWCMAVKFQGWAGENGANALLFTAGLKEKEQQSPASGLYTPKEKEVTLSEEEPVVDLPDDGIVPFHDNELPPLTATPDPSRKYAAVEEIHLDGGTQVGNFFVKDTSGSGTDLAAELEETPAAQIKGDGSIEVLIYHTHTSEAYSEEYVGFYYTDMETRTQNREKSVIAAGEEIKKALEAKGIGVVHDTTVNDTLYNGSYSRSWEVLQKNLEEYPSIRVTVDVHRDSMTTEEGIKYKPTAKINGRKAAQIMFLAGCDFDESWGDFPDWRENLRLALRVQETATELYPDLVRPLDFSNSKYNMNATTGSLLVEVGTEVNTAAEARYSGKLIGEVLAETLLQNAAENTKENTGDAPEQE